MMTLKVKLLITLVALLIISVSTFLITSDNQEDEHEVVITQGDVYLGPVPLGYDVEHFRKTGETILEVESG